jgi:PAS domain S-box-containing protein
MNEQHPESPQADSLRDRAEKAFREMPDGSLENLDALSPETLRASLHELRVHQIELEMQNEDLLRAQTDLDASRARYFDLYDMAPVGYCTVSEMGLILEANLTAATLLRIERGALVGKRMSAFISKEDQNFYYRCLKNLLDTLQPQECDLPMVRPDGTVFFAHLNFTVAHDENGTPVCRVALVDATASKRISAVLQARVRISEYAPAHSLGELLTLTLDEAELLTGSTIGFFHFVEADQFTLSLQEWSTNTRRRMCTAEGGGRHYPADEAGVWADALRERRPVIYNDYASLPHRKGLPPGHSQVVRMLVVPILQNDKVVALLGIGNKPGDYDSEDIEITSQLAGLSWDIAERKKLENTLRESEMHFRTLADSGEALIWTSGIDKKCNYFNRVWLDFTGRALEQELGDGWAEGVHPDDLGSCSRTYVEAFDRRTPFNMDYRLRRHDGEYRWLQDQGTPRYSSDGDFLGYIGHCMDITDRKQTEELLRESESRYAQLAEQSLTVTWEVDAQGLYTYISRVSETVWGYRPDELIGRKNFYDLHPEPGREEFKASAFTVFARKQPFVNLVNVIHTKDGRHVWVSTNGAPILNAEGTLCGYRGSDTDITERKEMDAKLLAALARAEAANRAKSDFLGVMSHELRTPLNGVLGFAQLLSETPLNDEQKSFVETVSSSGEHLLAIVADILDFSSIDSGALAIHFAPMAVADLVKTAEDPVRKTAAEKGLELRCELAAGVPEQIIGDKQRVRQILINLLGNAVKFTASGSVVLRVAPSSDEGRRSLDFCVEDTGIGISSETLSSLFKPFTQADSTNTREFGGVGLGLAISKRIAETMGGAITVTSTLGKGSAFTFRFPLETSSSKSGILPLCPEEPCGGTPLPHALALVADDDNASGVVAVKMLQNLGYQADFVADGAKAIEAFAPGKYSVILMDVSMPVMDGLVATGKIRKIEAGTGFHVPIIAFTANVLPGDRERCLAAGMDGFLSKPFGKEELAAKLACVAQGK